MSGPLVRNAGNLVQSGLVRPDLFGGSGTQPVARFICGRQTDRVELVVSGHHVSGSAFDHAANQPDDAGRIRTSVDQIADKNGAATRMPPHRGGGLCPLLSTVAQLGQELYEQLGFPVNIAYDVEAGIGRCISVYSLPCLF